MNSNHRTRILVFGGWFGSRNAGDEAILLGLKKLLADAYPRCELFAHSIDPDYTRDVCGVEPVYPRGSHFLSKAVSLIRQYRSMDLFLVSGGTPIFDYRLLSRAFHFGIPLMFGIPLVFVGIGVKPIRSRLGKWFYRNVLNRAKFVSVRDRDIVGILEEIGVTRQIHLTADSAICMDPGPDECARELLRDAGVDPQTEMVGICPIFLADDYQGHYHEPVSLKDREAAYGALARLADECIRAGQQAVFLPMHQVEPDNDMVVIQQIQTRMKEKPRIIKLPEDPQLIAAVLGHMNLVVGMRLHSLVLASSRNVPIVAIAFDMKVAGYMDFLGMPNYCEPIRGASYESIKNRFDACWSQREAVSSSIEDTMSTWRDSIRRSISSMRDDLDLSESEN